MLNIDIDAYQYSLYLKKDLSTRNLDTCHCKYLHWWGEGMSQSFNRCGSTSMIKLGPSPLHAGCSAWCPGCCSVKSSTAALQRCSTEPLPSLLRGSAFCVRTSWAAQQQQHTSGGLIPGTPTPDTAKLIGCLLLVADVAVERMCFIGSSTAKGCCCSL